MNGTQQRMGAAAILGIAAVAGVWAGQSGMVRLPLAGAAIAPPMTAATATAGGPVIYYRDPDGKPDYSATLKTTPDGRAFVAVRASEDVSFDKAKPPAVATVTGGSKIKYYRKPMGLPDTSPTPKKDSMGMDYIPIMEGETEGGGAVKLSPGKVQRSCSRARFGR